MKKFYGLFLMMSITSAAFSQQYCNEWLKFSIGDPYSSQPYLKIKVWQEGIHRLTYNDINQFIVTTGINPKQFQIFHKGIEQYIYVFDETDNIFDGSDFIEFYAKPNDGSFDTQLYDSAHFQLNPFYSMFNDTSAYFFTINAAGITNKRMNVVIDTDFSNPNYLLADYVMKDVWKEYHTDYFTGYSDASVDASYSQGEGFSNDSTFNGIASYNLSIPTLNPYTGGNAPPSQASTILLGANSGGGAREWNVSINNMQTATYTYWGYSLNHYNASFNLTGTPAVFSFVSLNNNTSQRNTVPYGRVIYPHTLDFTGESNTFQKFTLKGDVAPKTRLDILGFTAGSTWLYVFSGDTITKINADQNGSIHQALVATYGSDKLCVLALNTGITTGHSIATVSANPDPTRYTNYMFNNNLRCPIMIS